MVSRQTREQLVATGEVVGPPVERSCTDQTFELPNGLYVAMALMFSAFVAILAHSFSGGTMPVSYGVVAAFIAAFFAVPAILARSGASVRRTRALTWFEFGDRGIMTATGLTGAGEATVLVLLLPAAILMFGVAIVTIAALV